MGKIGSKLKKITSLFLAVMLVLAGALPVAFAVENDDVSVCINEQSSKDGSATESLLSAGYKAKSTNLFDKIAEIFESIFLAIKKIFGEIKDMFKYYAMPKDYQKTTKTGGEIEAAYLKNGSYEVSYFEEPTLQNFQKYEIYYPTELTSSDRKYPVIVVCNGSGTPASQYPFLLKHMASWGFIVIATEETYAWNGFGAEMSIRYLQRQNDNKIINDKESLFYGKVDFENVGIMGHSQGGVGVFNAISAQEHGDIYKAAVSLSPTKIELADGLAWHYDISEVCTPMLMIASTDEDAFVDPATLKEIYDTFPEETQKVMATKNGLTHNEMLWSSDGYVTAWFMWQLQGDLNAAKAFTGSTPEIMNNGLYQNQYSSIG